MMLSFEKEAIKKRAEELVHEVDVLPVNNDFFEKESDQYKDLKLEIIWGQGVDYIIKKK